MSNLHFQTASHAIQRIKNKEISPMDVIRASVERIKKLESNVNAWVCYDEEKALQTAREIDRKIAKDNYCKRLFGIPIGVKDIFNTADFKTEMGSNIWEGFNPGNDARTVFDIRYEDGIILGKTQSSEFAVHAPTDTKNPFALDRTCGTSSSGSAAAVSSGMVPLALASQTGASIIRPASFCGVFGFKPSFGLIPRTGVLKTTDTLDTIGFLSRSIEDLELLFDILRVHGSNYPCVDKYLKKRPIHQKLRLGVNRGPFWDLIQQDAKQAFANCLEKLSATGTFELVDYELEDDEEICELHEMIYCKALSYYFRGEKISDHHKISDVLVRMLDRGESITPDEYHEAFRKQSMHSVKYNNNDFDAIISLAAAGDAPPIHNPVETADSSRIWTYLGMPALSVPLLKTARGMPLGLQIVGKKYSDYHILEIARHIWACFGSRWQEPENIE